MAKEQRPPVFNGCMRKFGMTIGPSFEEGRIRGMRLAAINSENSRLYSCNKDKISDLL